MQRLIIFVYGTLAYALFLATFLYAIAFVGGFAVAKSLDSPAQTPLGPALVVDLLLLGVFAVQHSGMARSGFKKWLTRFVPEPAERSTYVWLSSLALILLFWQWRPLGGVIWSVDGGAARLAMWSLFGFGWLLILVTTFLINHFDLFGLRQVWLNLRGRDNTPLGFTTPGLYKLVRHPLYVGWLLAFWATPTMTVAHLVFALATTAYILVAIQLEERDLATAHAEYDEYRRRVPMLVPLTKLRGGGRREAGTVLP